MRLGIDATSVAPGAKGIARVQRGTVEALDALGRHELVVFARHPEELSVPAVRVAPRLTLAWEQAGLARALREHRLDALLTWTERLPVLGKGRFIVWLFEPPTHRIAENQAVGAGWWQRGSDLVTQAVWRRSLRRATAVLAGSQATADSLPVAARVLYPGLDPQFTPGPGREGRYVLHIGSRDPRDDTETALAAFDAARVRTGATLVVAGGHQGDPREGVEYVGRVSDEQLVTLYRGASAYLDTSLYEGFGYQVLEAMACGAPVVATSVTSIPELVGDAGLLCPPRAPAALADALVRVLDDEGLAADLRRRGLERARTFAWSATGERLADVVDEVGG